MKIAVCIKHVPDTETQVSLSSEGGLSFGELKKVINPYDEFAIEAALQAKETSFKEATVVAFTLGPNSASEALRTALAMGCDQAVHIHHDEHPGWISPLSAGQALGSVLNGFDLIFCGRQGIDHDDFTVPYVIAETCKASCINVVKEITYQPDGTVTVIRESDGGQKETYSAPLPLVLGVTIGINKPRYPSLPGIMKAKTKPLETKPLNELVPDCHWIEPMSYELPKPKGTCKMIDGTPDEQASEIAKIIKDELHLT